MKISQTVSRLVQEDIELETPAFFKNEYGSYTGIYSEDSIVSLTSLSGGYLNISKRCAKDMDGLLKIIKSQRITEEEFNLKLEPALFELQAVLMVGPQLQTS